MFKTVVVRSVAGLFALAGFWIAHTQQPPAQPLQMEKVKEGLYNISGSGGNVGVLTTDEGVIIVDNKFSQNTPEILAKVKSVSDKPVRYVFTTHHHGDHTGGNVNLLPTSEIIAHSNNRINIIQKKQPGAPRIVFTDEFGLYLGGKEVLAKWWGRGHTNGDAIIYFPALKTIHTGDLFVASEPFMDYSSGGSGVAWTQTIDAVMQLDFDTVIPGHGPIMKRDDLKAFRNKLETYRTRVGDLKRKGITREEAAKQTLDLKDIGWTMTGMLSRGFSGLWDELQ